MTTGANQPGPHNMNLVNLFKNSGRIETFKSGETIFRQGEPGDCMYIILEGDIEIRVSDNFFETMHPGDIIGEMALIDDQERSATAIAKSDCRVVPVDERRFQFLVQETPFFSLHVMRELVARLRRVDQRM